MTQTLISDRASAARARAEGMAARADRPRQRRSAADLDSPAPRLAGHLRAEMRAPDEGSTMLRFRGVASVTEHPYELYDMFGPYTEIVDRHAFDVTLARNDLDVPLVLDHDQMRRIARTTAGTLRLSAPDEGLTVEADLDPADPDVDYAARKLAAGLYDEMSFAFRIDAGQWSPDYTEYRITQVDLHRGDVAIVGYGANPATTAEPLTPARSDAAAGLAREELPAAPAPADDLPAELTTDTPERSPVTMTDTTELAAPPVEPSPAARAAVTTPEPNSPAEAAQSRIADLEEQLRIAQAARAADAGRPAYDQVARVGAEARTYTPETDRTGRLFISDVVRNFYGDGFESRDRLARHMQEERVERGPVLERAAGTSAFGGLVVPQYLVDLVAPLARAARPFADAARNVPLPEQGMTVELAKVTTGTTTALQASQNTAVSETDIATTPLSVPVQTIAGSQTVSRQAVERGSNTLDTVLEDLGRAYATVLDSTMLNQASTGLTNVATLIAFTSGSPTAALLYPKLLQATAAVEAALIDQQSGDTIAVMHSRRWYWLQSQLSSTFPLIAQPGAPFNVAGVNYGKRYGSGYRGVLPSGVPVIVDNNVGTSFDTNEDEIYFVGANDVFLFEDPAAPMLIRTDTGPNTKSLGVDVVVYGYAAYTHTRRAHAQKIGGTGLIVPAWT